jgi:hypothetical protein
MPAGMPLFKPRSVIARHDYSFQRSGMLFAVPDGISRRGGRHDEKKTGDLFDLPAFCKMRFATGRVFHRRHPLL